MEHERMRFATMTPRQLRTRLNRITDREKLRRFLIVCAEKIRELESAGLVHRAADYRDLQAEAHWKLYGYTTFGAAKDRERILDDDYLKRIGI